MNDEHKLIANITVPVDDVTEQAWRGGYLKGRHDRAEDFRIEQIAHHYGYTNQREQFVEECGEAIVAAQKCKRDGSMKAFTDLAGEVADVLIMARQMRLLMSPSLIDAIIDSKIERQLDRIKEEGGEEKGRIQGSESMAEIKPCPFCGETVKLKKTNLVFDNYYIEHETANCILSNGKCFHAETEAEAIKRWNSRFTGVIDKTGKKIYDGDVLRICQLEEQLEKAKELLKAAMEDMNSNNICFDINAVKHCISCDTFHWRYTDEALKLLGEDGESNGV